MNRLSREKQALVINLLVEGNSLRGTSRITGVNVNTIMSLLVDVGTVAFAYQDMVMRNLPCTRIQVDELWAFCYAKNKSLTPQQRKDPRIGNIWTWTAICPDTKIIPCWHVGSRGIASAHEFMKDLAPRFASRIQLTSDGHKAYIDAVDDAFGDDVDFAQLVKMYDGKPDSDGKRPNAKYTGATKTPLLGRPDAAHISTSICERLNLTIRMENRRYGRKTNAFSKKIENHIHALSLHTLYYNFARVHKTLRVTPAMEAGLADHVWSFEEIVSMIPEPIAKKRGPYKPRLSKGVNNKGLHP